MAGLARVKTAPARVAWHMFTETEVAPCAPKVVRSPPGAMGTKVNTEQHERGDRDTIIEQGIESIRAVPETDLRWARPAVRFSAQPSGSERSEPDT